LVGNQAMRVLLVEDNAVNQKVAQHLLDRLGYRPDVAADGVEALEALAQQHYDVVLMDVQMPRMDGVEATRLIRGQLPAADQPWIVALTANALIGDREKYLAAGMDDYLAKPISRLELAEALARCAGPRSETSPARGIPGLESKPEPEWEASAGEGSNIATIATRLNPVLLREMLGGDAAPILVELLSVFHRTAPDLIVEMRSALAGGDDDGVGRAAFSLKGEALAIAATELAERCEAVEKLALEGRFDACSAAVNEVALHVEQLAMASS
jgi:CheY-like chemotaxis protein/HPt (histidine-containing phosphotransfer) domain-containing protein